MNTAAPALPTSHRGRIRRRLMGWGLGLLALALISNTISGFIYTRAQLLRGKAELHQEVAATTARRMADVARWTVLQLETLSTNLAVHPFGSMEQEMLARLVIKHDPSVAEIVVVDRSGAERVRLSATESFSSAERRNHKATLAFTRAIAGENYIGPVLTFEQAVPYLTIGIPVRSSPVEVTGALLARVEVRILWEMIAQVSFGAAGYAYVIDDSGTLIAHKDASLVLKRVTTRNAAKLRRAFSRAGRDPAPAEIGVGINGGRVLSTYAQLPELGWVVIVEEPTDLALAELDQLQRYAGLLLALGLMLGAGIIAFVSRKLTRPMGELQKDVRRIAAGDLRHRASVSTGDEVEDLADDFNRMAQALQQSHESLERQVSQRTQEITALYDVTRAVNGSLELQHILDTVLAKMAQIFHFGGIQVYLFGDQPDVLEFRALHESDPQCHWSPNSFKRGTGIVGKVAESGQPMIFEDVHGDPRYQALSMSKAARTSERRFFAVFPIKNNVQIFGTLIFSDRVARQLTDEEVRLIHSMSEHIGVAVERAQLFDNVARRSQHLAVLHTIGESVNQSLDVQFISNVACKRVVETLGFDGAWIYQLAANEEAVRLCAHAGLSSDVLETMSVRSADYGTSALVRKTGEPVVVEDLENDEQYRAVAGDSRALALGFQSAAAFPILIKGRSIGSLHVASQKRRRFGTEELRLLDSIAHDIGVASENARLFEQVSQQSAELLQVNNELQEANRAKSGFIAAVSHDLRTPLNIMIGNADLGTGEFFGALDAEYKRAFGKIAHHGRMVLKMVNDMLTLSRFEAKQLSLEVAPVALDEIIEHAKSHVEYANRDKNLSVCWEVDSHLPDLLTDPVKLEEILQNLIGNAFKFTEQGNITVAVRRRDERVEFSVADTGVGIAGEHLGKIFDEFEQVNKSRTGNHSGAGLGLAIVKKYLDLMQGDIAVESAPGLGTTFTFSLPHNVMLHS